MARHLNRNIWKEGTYMRVKHPNTIRMLMDRATPPISIRDLANRSNGTKYETKRAIIGHVLSGFRQTVDPRTAIAISNGIGVTVETLFDIETQTDREWVDAYNAGLAVAA